jgi:hypothetical protein
LTTPIGIKLYRHTSELPNNWDALAGTNVFLSKSYLEITKKSAPSNMCCFFMGFYADDKLIGIAIAQYLDLLKLSSFGERDQCVKTWLRNFVFRNLASNVLILGNNMLTGENGWAFDASIPAIEQFKLLNDGLNSLVQTLKTEGIGIHIQIAKDFYHTDFNRESAQQFTSFYQFYIQPNMVFSISQNWNNETDYVNALQKKYRDQWKRARKKAEHISRRAMQLAEIQAHEQTLHELYFTVAKNAPFNTFFLNANHFADLKENLGDAFCLYGYFEQEKLIGFCTLIKNGEDIDTYFLGYNDEVQKRSMLYLNMLYDMLAFSIQTKAKKLILARTALEIKSSIGAKAIPMFGYIKHRNPLLNYFMKRIFLYMQPEIQWQERHPFK